MSDPNGRPPPPRWWVLTWNVIFVLGCGAAAFVLSEWQQWLTRQLCPRW
jgi:hypothetical protein